MIMSWGTNWTGYTLYSSASLAADATWNQVTNKPVTIGTSLVVTNAMDSGSQFYRLVLP